MKNKKRGITLIVLVITIIVGLILVSAGIVSVSSAISEATKASFAEELKLIEDETSVYYLQNNEYPAKMNEAGDDFEVKSPKEISELLNSENKFNELANEMKENKENGDSDVTSEVETKAFYVLDLDKLPLEKKTRGIKKGNDETDIYVVSANTNKVYYLKGVKTGGKTYFSLANLIKYVGKVVSSSEGEVEVQQVGSLTVKRLKKTWTNAMGIKLNVSDTTGEISATLKTEEKEISNSTFKLQESYTINTLADIPDANFGDVSEFYSSKKKSIVFRKGADVLEVDLSNYDTQAPTYDDPDTWKITQTNEDNVITFNVKDDISGVKEIRYAYLEKYTGDGDDCGTQYYYKDVEVLDASFIKARGKKATISSEGEAVLKVPRDIAAIQIVAIDKAGNYPVDAVKGNGIFYVVKKDYVGCKLKFISSTGLTFYALFNSKATGNYIAEYNVSVSTDGKNYTAPITKTSSGTLQSLKDLVEDYKTGLTIADKVYVKVVGTFKKQDNTTEDIERIFEFGKKNEDNPEINTGDVTIGEKLTLSVENPKENAEYSWRSWDNTFKATGSSMTLNEAEVIAYEGISFYYIEIDPENNTVKQSEPYNYTVNYTITTDTQFYGILKILGGSEGEQYNFEGKCPGGTTAIIDTDGDIQTLRNKTITLGNNITLSKDMSVCNKHDVQIQITFSGTLDGNGYTINMSNKESRNGGLFTILSEYGTIKNLNIANLYLTKTPYCYHSSFRWGSSDK